MSQPFKISYGPKAKKTAPSKPGGPPKRKPVFGGGDDDNSDDDQDAGGVFARGKKSAAPLKKKLAEPAAEAITELGDDFMMGTVALANDDDDDRRKSKAQRKGAQLSQPPPSKYKTPAQDADGPLSSTSRFGSDLASAFTARKHVEAAEALDASIYDYDASYDAFKAAGKKKKGPAKEDGDDDNDEDGNARKSQYMTSLRKMAEVRERDRRIAEDRKMQREREAEGDDFADKEKFVTEAYKKQQEENRKLEEEERKREEAEAARAAETGGMTGFYKELLVRDEQRQAAIQEALEQSKISDSKKGDADDEKDKKSDDQDEDTTTRARDINARGGNVAVNDDGEVVDKRQLLRGGLNVTARKKTEMEREKEREKEKARRDRERERERNARDSEASRAPKAVFNGGSRQAMRDRQSQMLEEQYAQSLKRTRDEEEEKARAADMAAKSRKTTADISSAKERYLARKRAEAEAKKA
ncbi:coiled-coil domain-containing protein 55 [Ophiostoma piceae UAMH 11346]|uniref:Coiled-coil domain-containing protein 55 n=1 Tax=Ophiostoma piceae (strain UAMH 11346) TaxID=1262450 RepID=S3C9T6_OPHP1|nr:coiled-coil domain-containing protein 55 [Ophiostoma piceae UAMH 11346]